MADYLTVEQNGAVAEVTINRPEKMNALNTATVMELYQEMKVLEGNEAIRCVILTGAGEKAFAAGADVTEIQKHNEVSGTIFAQRGQKVFRFIERMSKPVIAAVNGYALGGGCELAMACHVRIASENARFGQPEINLGIIPGYGGTQRLPRLIGLSHALYLLLTGEMISAQKALELGLVVEVIPAGELLKRARELAQQLAEKAPVAVSLILKAVNQGINLPMDSALNLEAELFGAACQTEDMKEGIQAFLEKRKAQFKGR